MMYPLEVYTMIGQTASFLPQDFLKRMEQILPDFSGAGLFAPKDYVGFRVNTLKTDVQGCGEWFKDQGLTYEPWPIYPQALVVKRHDASIVKSSTLVSTGKLYPQGLQSMLPVMVLAPQPGERVLDLCAAPGSKTSQIGAHFRNEGVLIANDIVRSRFYKLKAVLELTGTQAKVTLGDGRRFKVGELFDKILVDAPCSSEGRFCLDDPKSIGFWSVRKIHECAHKQKGLLMNAARLLKPGGALVYSTCTYAPEENEAVVDWVLRKDPQLSVVPLDLGQVTTYPALRQWQGITYDARVTSCTRIFPDAKLEGFFIAKLVKSHYK